MINYSEPSIFDSYNNSLYFLLQQERFIVLENYQAQTSDEMTVYKNDVVFLVSRPKKNANFLHVRNFCRERSGLVPATILKRMSEETEGKRQKGGGL